MNNNKESKILIMRKINIPNWVLCKIMHPKIF